MDSTESFRKQSVRVAAASFAIGALMAIGATPARADLGNLSVVINSGVTGDHVSYSQPAAGKQAALPVWAAFTVDVTNPAPNNVSNAWITFTDSKGTQLKVPPAVVATGDASGTCDFGADNTTVVCKVSLAGNSGGSLHFVLRALSPQQPASLPTTAEQFFIDWSVQSGQGAAGANPSQVIFQSSGFVYLDAGSPTELKGYIDHDISLAVQDAGGSSTSVSPPGPVTVQDLKQEVSPSSCSNQYKICLQSTLSIPGQTFSPPLFVDLLRAKSTLKGGAKIGNLTLYYSDATANPAILLAPIIQCDLALNADAAVITNWSIPNPVVPPFAPGRCYIPASPTNPFTYVDKATGDWHIRLLENTNGITNW